MNSATLIVLGVLLGVLSVGLVIFLAVLLFSIWSLRASVIRLISIVEPIAQQTSLPSMARAVVALAEAGPGIGQHIQSLVAAVDKLQVALFAESTSVPVPAGNTPAPPYNPSVIGRETVKESIDEVRRTAAATVGTQKVNPVADAIAASVAGSPALTKLTPATDENSGFFAYDPEGAAAQEAHKEARKHGVELDESKGGPPAGESGANVASV
jgi:hypothetical protein